MPTSTISKAKIAANKRGVSGSLHTFRCGHPAASLIDEMPEEMISDQMDMFIRGFARTLQRANQGGRAAASAEVSQRMTDASWEAIYRE